MENNITEAINWLQKTGSAVQDFAVEQAPLYCREIVALEVAKGYALIAVSVVAWIAAIVLWRKSVELAKYRKGEFSEDGIGSFVISCIFAGAGLAMLAGGTVMTVKAKIAPRIVIVEHLRNL